jgi:hypothetical protein
MMPVGERPSLQVTRYADLWHPTGSTGSTRPLDNQAPWGVYVGSNPTPATTYNSRSQALCACFCQQFRMVRHAMSHVPALHRVYAGQRGCVCGGSGWTGQRPENTRRSSGTCADRSRPGMRPAALDRRSGRWPRREASPVGAVSGAAGGDCRAFSPPVMPQLCWRSACVLAQCLPVASGC